MNLKNGKQKATHDSRKSIRHISPVALPVVWFIHRLRQNLDAFFLSDATLATAAGNNESKSVMVTGIVSKKRKK